jgi:cytosolic tryparedoxin peroxidase, trypanosomatid typical 2-Cys peroxiredoxin
MNILPYLNHKAPEFKGKVYHNNQHSVVSNKDYLGKWLILFFYPLDFSFICPTEICGLSDIKSKFENLNCDILACSVDSIENHESFSNKPRTKGGLSPCNIALLSDPSKKIAVSYGVLIDYGSNEGCTQRATFIIDPQGNIRSIDINDITVGRNIDQIYERLALLQDAKGENK